MQLVDRVFVPLRVLLVLFFAGLVVAQVLSMPGMFGYLASQSPEFGMLPWVLLAFSIAEIICVQIVIVCIWKLLAMVKSDRIFSPEAFVWVDAIVGAMAAAWVLLAGVFVYISVFLYFTPRLRDPGMPMMLFGMVLAGAVLVLVMVVMRALLRQATTLRTDLEAVI